MGNLSLFLKKNKKVKENAFYPATKSLCDEKGEPLLWEIKALTTSETEKIREKYTSEVPVTGKNGMYRMKFDSRGFIASMIASSVVFPDLYNKELQDSYGVTTPEALVRELVDNPSEYNDFAEYIQNFNGIAETMEEKVEEAKN